MNNGRRANYLESEVADCFETAFSASAVHRSVKWSIDRTQYETDLILIIDTHLFIVEAKSHRVSWPALRGAPDRVKREIEQILVAPALQSMRLETELRKKQQDLSIDLRMSIDLDLSQITNFSRISVSLEDFSTIQSNLKDIESAGLAPKGLPLAVSMSLSDLKVVFEILETPVERMHYLARRKQIQERWEYFADELDLLGLYLATGLDIGELEAGETKLTAVGMSAKIDAYYAALDQDITTEKPKRRMTPWFAAIRDRLASRTPPKWSTAALALLDIGLEDQMSLEAHFAKVCKSMKSNRKTEIQHQNTTAAYPEVWRKMGLAVVAFYEDERSERHKIMENAAIGIFKNSSAEQCLVIVQDLDRKDHPYTSLMVFDRPDDL